MIASPAALLAVVVGALAYWMGCERWSDRAGRRMVGRAARASFLAGVFVVAVALASPIDVAADRSLTAHMVQHVLLLAVAAPLLALGQPVPALLWALPERGRRRAGAITKRGMHVHDVHFVAWVTVVLGLEAVVMWLWHLPVAYQAALHNAPLHACEHASFLLVAAAAWWSVTTGRRSRRGAAAVAALLGSVPGSLLGLAMVLAPHPWYPAYATGSAHAALADQQLAGVIMWAFGGMAAVIAGAALFAVWLATDAPEPVARLESLGATS